MDLIKKHYAYTLLKPRYSAFLTTLHRSESEFIASRINDSSIKPNLKEVLTSLIDVILTDIRDIRIRDAMRQLISISPDSYVSVIKGSLGIIYSHVLENYPGDIFPEKLYNYIHQKSEVELCQLCKVKPKSWLRNFNKGYSNFCSIKCCNKDEELKSDRTDSYMSVGIKLKQQKDRERYLEKYGVDSYFKTSEYREKVKATCMKRYGVTSIMQHPPIADKVLNKFKTKTMILRNKEVKFKGYENVALKTLDELGLILDNDYKFGILNMPKILYEFLGKTRRYYSDIYIPKLNLLIEVKSSWTLINEEAKNIEKHLASIKSGFNHEFWICNSSDLISVIKSPITNELASLQVNPKFSIVFDDS